jgi:hypothetical protein
MAERKKAPGRLAHLPRFGDTWFFEAKDSDSLATATRVSAWLRQRDRPVPAFGFRKAKAQPRQVFVAYAYNLFPEADYRRVFKDLAKAFQVEFRFADEKITDLHILTKIKEIIQSSAFGLYDISGWNANVTLELGLALGLGEKAFIIFNPGRIDISDVPSDVRGMDRIQYNSYSELEQKLASLLSQELPLPKHHQITDQLTELRGYTVALLHQEPGLKINQIADKIGVPKEMAQIIVRPMVDAGILKIEGATRAAKYFATSVSKS